MWAAVPSVEKESACPCSENALELSAQTRFPEYGKISGIMSFWRLVVEMDRFFAGMMLGVERGLGFTF